MNLSQQMDPKRTTANDVQAASLHLGPTFQVLANQLHLWSGEDLSTNTPTPELFAAAHGWFDVYSRSLKAEGELPDCFESVSPAFRNGTIQIDFRIAPAFRGLLGQLGQDQPA